MQEPVDIPPDRNSIVVGLFHRQRSALVGYFRSRGLTREQIPDCFQETFFRVLRVKDLSAIADLDAYLFAVASSVWADFFKKRSKEPPTTFDSEQADTASDSPILNDPDFNNRLLAEKSGTGIDIRHLLKGLPREHREILVMKRHGLTVDEIAVRKSCSRAEIKRLIGQAYAHIKGKL